MSDIALKLVDNCLNIALREDGAALEVDNGLETAVFISLFTDQRVSASELPAGETNQRGWWGDQFADTSGDQIGSKMWLAMRGKVNQETAIQMEFRAQNALQWLIDDGVASSVEVSSEYSNGELQLRVEITRPQSGVTNLFEFLWDGQRLKRG